MTGIEETPPPAPASSVSNLPPIDVILPIGKPGAPASRGLLEMTRFKGRTLLEWAVEEALRAGAGRIIMVAPKGYGPAPRVAQHLRRAVAAQTGATAARADAAGQGAAAAVATRHQPQIVVLSHPLVDPSEGWDELIRVAANHCRGQHALMIDPTILLTSGNLVATFASFMVRRAEATGTLPRPLIALAGATWEDALCLPVVPAAEMGAAQCLSFDRRPAAGDELPVFAGRALLPLPLPVPPPDAVPADAIFPFEPLTALLLAVGSGTASLQFRPIDCRFHTEEADCPQTQAAAHGIPFTSRLGLAALQKIA